MQICPASSSEPAAWISHLSFAQATTFGPAGFEAYARLRFIPDPSRVGQRENDVEVAEDQLCDLDQARRALDVLTRYTSTPGQCYFCIWDGYTYDRLAAGSGSYVTVDLPHRRYLLLEGPLTAVQTWEEDLGLGGPLVPPAFVWPADHEWVFVCDVDPHWAGIGGRCDAVADLIEDDVLDIVSADPLQPQPFYY